MGVRHMRASAGLCARTAVLLSGLAATQSYKGQTFLGTGGALFVVHDAGETLALLPVVQRLRARGQESFRMLPLGEPATSIVLCRGRYSTDTCKPTPAVTLSDLGIEVSIADGSAGRAQTLADSHIQVLRRKLGPGTAVVVSGMNYVMQFQIGQALQEAGATFASYDDGLSVLGSGRDPSESIQLPFAQGVNELWVPSLILRPAAPEWSHAGTTWFAVGQPTLETWEALRTDTDLLRQARSRIYGPKALTEGTASIVWFGSYGATYEEALRTWCRAAKSLRSDASFGPILFSLAVHPGPYGEVDRRVLREEGVEELLALVPEDIPGAVAALASNLTASEGSTAGEQSLFVGKPALFVDPSGSSSAERLGSVLGLIPSVGTSGEAAAAVRQVASESWNFDPAKLESAGLPTHATQEIARRIGQLFRPAWLL